MYYREVIVKRYLILILFNRAYEISYFYNLNFIKDTDTKWISSDNEMLIILIC